jgi:Na+-transporting NADH:ubiquinone oxidoreductase subunit A
MAQVIKIKKGLDINLKGRPQAVKKQMVLPDIYTLFPNDFHGFVPKVAVKQGDRVKVGTPVLFDKNRPEIKIVSPVSGEVLSINRGEKRKLLSIVIRSNGRNTNGMIRKKDVKSFTSEAIKSMLAEAGILAYIRQRPYDIIADPKDTPRDIFIPGFYSAPLTPDLDFILEGQEEDFQTGLDALTALTSGKVYLGIRPSTQNTCLTNAKNVEIVTFDGPHPAGNAGVQANHIKPVGKGEVIWTVDPAFVLFIGRYFNKGVVDFSRWVSLTGSEIKPEGRAYYSMLPGAGIEELIKNCTETGMSLRYISGNVLTGTLMPPAGSLHAFDNQITVIPEGDQTHELFGWMTPGFNKFSVSRTFPTFIASLLSKNKKEYTIDARLRGGRRAMIMSDEWDKVFPMDILPEFLIRAIIASDVEKMENLGIYEVAPEDFALCEFVDTSKMELQVLVRQGLDWLYKEMKG